MAIAMNDLVDKVETILFDESNDRFDAADLILYANEAERAIVTRKPDAYVKNENTKLAIELSKKIIEMVDNEIVEQNDSNNMIKNGSLYRLKYILQD